MQNRSMTQGILIAITPNGFITLEQPLPHLRIGVRVKVTSIQTHIMGLKVLLEKGRARGHDSD